MDAGDRRRLRGALAAGQTRQGADRGQDLPAALSGRQRWGLAQTAPGTGAPCYRAVSALRSAIKREAAVLEIAAWLRENVAPIKTLTVGSYSMKHVVERA